ncbi:LptA/OstA family protein [Kordiimonas aquimaris]|uniref:LptA/OstA family protein n=1 Tax=Kordiimonas aquimaris TaxID=707591 RepID=UPI0021CFE14F|nr:LptA/OstA family protein [Kordiimonas aquimaris]
MTQKVQKIQTIGAQPLRRIFAVFSIALAFNTTAVAQSILKDHDTRQPLDISAERLEMQQKQGRAIFSGAVQVTQGKLLLRSDTITVFYKLDSGDTNPAISRLDAQGKFSVTSETETLTGDWGIYDVDRQLITVGGDVSFDQGGSELKGSRLEFDLVSGLAKLDGQDAGGANGRVRGSFSVPAKPDDGTDK